MKETSSYSGGPERGVQRHRAWESKETKVNHSRSQWNLKAAHGCEVQVLWMCGDCRLEKLQKLDHKGFHANLMSSVFIFWVMAAGHLVLSRERNKLEKGFCPGCSGRRWEGELKVEEKHSPRFRGAARTGRQENMRSWCQG